jgi:protein-S-isoprenylcysteine O-methyltransferase Ste14
MHSDHSKPLICPPLIPVTSFLAGIALDRLLPLRAHVPDLRALGAVIFGVGIAGFFWMIATMKLARTPIHNAKTPTALVQTGPFRWTRNPMYLFGNVWYVGLALLLREPGPLLFVPVAALLTHYCVVLREEEYLARKFGADYERYRERVRRWL